MVSSQRKIVQNETLFFNLQEKVHALTMIITIFAKKIHPLECVKLCNFLIRSYFRKDIERK